MSRQKQPKEPDNFRPNVPIVFISSTNEDLKPHRAAARDAAISARLLPEMQEYFTADGQRPPLPACLNKVSASDVVVVIVAHRFGWEPKQRAKRNWIAASLSDEETMFDSGILLSKSF